MRFRFARALVIGALLVSAYGFVPSPTHATLSQDVNSQIDAAGTKAGLTKENPQTYIASYITILLSLIGTLFLALLIYAGYLRLTSHGDSDRVEKSNKTAIAGVVGLVIVLLAYATTRFVVTRIYNAATYDPVYDENNDAPDTIYKRSINIKLF